MLTLRDYATLRHKQHSDLLLETLLSRKTENIENNETVDNVQ